MTVADILTAYVHKRTDEFLFFVNWGLVKMVVLLKPQSLRVIVIDLATKNMLK
jgi:hypothetical protein